MKLPFTTYSVALIYGDAIAVSRILIVSGSDPLKDHEAIARATVDAEKDYPFLRAEGFRTGVVSRAVMSL